MDCTARTYKLCNLKLYYKTLSAKRAIIVHCNLLVKLSLLLHLATAKNEIFAYIIQELFSILGYTYYCIYHSGMISSSLVNAYVNAYVLIVWTFTPQLFVLKYDCGSIST